MVRKYLRNISTVIFMGCSFILMNSQQSFAQQGVLGTQTHVTKWLQVGALRSWFSNFGAEGEYFRRDRTTYVSQDQIDGLCWPQEYNNRMKGVKVGKGLWIGTTNFQDPVSNTTYAHKVVCNGKNAVYGGSEFIGDESIGNVGINLVGQFPHPSVYVDGASASQNDIYDILDKEDGSLPSDRMILNQFHTSIGVSVTRKILAFSQQYNDNYFIYDYTLTNTGIIDAKGTKLTPARALTGVIFYLQSRYSFAGESYTGQVSGGWFPSGTSWGRNTILDAVGQDASHSLAAPNDFRAVFGYWGPVSSSVVGLGVADDIGCPGPAKTNVWTLAGYQFAGSVVLHADKSATDPSDDPSQPKTTQFVGADNATNAVNQYSATLMTTKYNTFMNAGHATATLADQIGKDANGWPTQVANTFNADIGADAGGYMATQGFGPYDLEPGQSVHIVVAEAVAGISRPKVLEVAKNWWSNAGSFVLPKGFKNGATTSDRNEYKNAWVFSGKDSLFQSFRRALAAYKNGYSIPTPPPPPDKFEVNSGGDRINISWSSSAESAPHFGGYRLYRAEGRADTTFDLIQEWDKGNVVNSYADKNAKRGFNYYYYIQTKSDGTDNPGNAELNIPAGEPLVSSKYYTMTNTGAYLTRPAGEAITSITNTEYLTGDGTKTVFLMPRSVTDSTGTVIYGLSVLVNNIKQIPASYKAKADTLIFLKAPMGNIEVQFISPTGKRDYSLSKIRIVPNPFNLKARNVQFGIDDKYTLDKLSFYNLPPVCKIRIFTETGDLISTIDHTNGSGDDAWYSKTSSNQIVVSGLYIAHFEVTEDYIDENTGQLLYKKGDSVFKKFIIIR